MGLIVSNFVRSSVKLAHGSQRTRLAAVVALLELLVNGVRDDLVSTSDRVHLPHQQEGAFISANAVEGLFSYVRLSPALPDACAEYVPHV
ncbi:hypothetical protein [Nonomuraea endophytica]|uniref:hypothetical protein n=1 Tax=Nonomuraea endophytica TaxID=714136 RepID=UPI0037CA8BA4